MGSPTSINPRETRKPGADRAAKADSAAKADRAAKEKQGREEGRSMTGDILIDTLRKDSTNYKLPRGLLWYTETSDDRVIVSLPDAIAPLSAIITSTNILRMRTAVKQARENATINIAINTGTGLDLQVTQALVVANLMSVSRDNMKNLQAYKNSSRLRGMYECLLAFAALYKGTYIARKLKIAKLEEVYSLYRAAKDNLSLDASKAAIMYMKHPATYAHNTFKRAYQHQVEGILKLGALSRLAILDKQIAAQGYAINNGIELLNAMKSIIDDNRAITLQDLTKLYTIVAKGGAVYSVVDKNPELISSRDIELDQVILD